MMSSESTSVVMTVENAQNWIASDVEALIDCLADLTSKFEIIVVDNGSRDYTVEILEDLRCRFPQIRYRRLIQAQAAEEAMAFGLEMADGELVFTAVPNSRIEPEELRRLWALRTDPRLLMARSRTTARRIDPGLITRLANWTQRMSGGKESPAAATESWGGLQMLRREAVEHLRPMLANKMNQQAGPPQIEISHVSHQQLANPKLAETRRRNSESFVQS